MPGNQSPRTDVFAPSARRTELRALTGLRGLCASFVVIAHYDFRDISNVFAITRWHNPAVDIFFVLSGFTMFYVHGPEREPLDFPDFMAKRIARLWPLAVVTLLLMLPFLHYLVPPDLASRPLAFLSGFLRQVLLVNCWPLVGTGFEVNGPQWSASVEMLMYIAVFPLLYGIVGVVRKADPALLAGSCFGLMALSCLTYLQWFSSDFIEGRQVDHPDLALLSMSLRGAFGFSAGYLCFYYCSLRRSLSIEWALGDAVSIVFLLVVAGAALDAWPYQLVAVMAPAIVACNTGGNSLTARWLASNPMCYLGRISYSIYLLHVPLVWYANPVVGKLAQFAGHPLSIEMPGRIVALILILPLSSLSYRYVEAPARSRLYRMIRGSAARRRAAPVS